MNTDKLEAALKIQEIINTGESLRSAIRAVLDSDNRNEAVRQWAFEGLTDESNSAWVESLARDEDGNRLLDDEGREYTTWSLEECAAQLNGHVDACEEMIANFDQRDE